MSARIELFNGETITMAPGEVREVDVLIPEGCVMTTFVVRVLEPPREDTQTAMRWSIMFHGDA